LILCCFILITALTICPNVSETAMIQASASEFTDKSGDLSVASPTKEQIKTMWEKITTYSTKYATEPSVVSPYSIGALNADYLQNGEDYLNLIRYMAGLPAIQLSDEMNEAAQYGAVLLAASEFSHYPSQPADMDNDFYSKGVSATSSSNIAWGYRDIASSISGYMSDEDPGNISAVGHRRWLLNPKLYYVGFGEANNSFATKVFDQSGSGVDYDFISWPPSGNCPDSFFRYYDPWSITLNPSEYSKIQDIKIVLTRTSDGKVWNFDSDTSNDPNTQGEFLNINLGGYGVSNCIIFRPALGDISVYGGVYTVEVSGLYDKNEAPVTLKYQTDFFNFYDYYKVVSYPKEIGGECTIGCVECDYTKSFKPNTSIKASWNDDNGAVWSSGFENKFNVGDKLYMNDFEAVKLENQLLVHLSDETAINCSVGDGCDYIFSFNKEGIYNITLYLKYSPCVYRTYTVYVGNTEGMEEPDPFIHYSGYPALTVPHTDSDCTEEGCTEGTKCAVCGEILSGCDIIPAKGHNEEIVYPTEIGGDCKIECTDCDYTDSFKTNSSMELWWNRDGSGSYRSGFDNNFNIGDKLYLWDNDVVDISTAKLFTFSDESAIDFVQGIGYEDSVFTFVKEGIYSFTISYKYSPMVYRTYTVVVKDPNKTYDIGDVNEDGNIDKSDYLLIKRYCFDTASLSDSQKIIADINGDGDITKEDYILLKRHCFGTYSIG